MPTRETSRTGPAQVPQGDAGRLRLSPLYAILDIDCLQALAPGTGTELLSAVLDFASQLHDGGVRLLQYRAKRLPAQSALVHARALRQTFPELKLIMNDRADLCLAADFDGVHVGQDDLWPEAVRGLIGSRIVGVSTHNPEQVAEASASPADYVAIGPVFATGSKLNPDPVVGLEGVRRARQLTTKPLVAIGGITLENCREVREAGADSVAIISALMDRPRESAAEFLRVFA
ncbi:MAG: thiamine phosphate synthase [Candidatus Korobacteraceae bacterium]